MSRCPDCDCETVFSSTTRRTLLGTGSLAVIILIVSPSLFERTPVFPSHQTRTIGTHSTAALCIAEHESITPASFRQVIMEVEGMTGNTCPVTVRKALKDVQDVSSPKAMFDSPKAVVHFDPETTSVETLTQATKSAGFPSHAKSTP